MPTLPRPTSNTAFRTGTYPGMVAVPARRPPVSIPAAPPAPQAVPSARPRQQVQNLSMLLLVLLAAVVVVSGLVYLSGYAQVTQERYRQVKLQYTLKQALDIQQRLQQKKAQRDTPTYIAAQASKLGMVRPDDRQIFTVGETKAFPVTPPALNSTP